MHVENVMFLGWVAMPLIAYVGGKLALSRTERSRERRPAPDAEQRLEQLRLRMAEGGWAPRGRMAEAVRLAESARAPAPLRARQP